VFDQNSNVLPTSSVRFLNLEGNDHLVKPSKWLPCFPFLSKLSLGSYGVVVRNAFFGGGPNNNNNNNLVNLAQMLGFGVQQPLSTKRTKSKSTGNDSSDDDWNDTTEDEDDNGSYNFRSLVHCEYLTKFTTWGNAVSDSSFEKLRDEISIEEAENGNGNQQIINHSLSTSLQTLFIRNSQSFTNRALSALGDCHFSNLRELRISSVGEICDKGFGHFFTHLMDRSPTKTVPLRVIDFSDCRAGIRDSVLPWICSYCPLLEEFDVTQSAISSESFNLISNLKNLKTLKLNRTQNLREEAMKHLIGLENLTSLDVSGNRWIARDRKTEGVEYISQIPWLSQLFVRDCQSFGDDCFEVIATRARRLTFLDCSRNMMMTNTSLVLLKSSLLFKDETILPGITRIHLESCFAFSKQLKTDLSDMYASKGIFVDFGP
jgi:hypothetical protein